MLSEKSQLFSASTIQVGITLFQSKHSLALLKCLQAKAEKLLLCSVCVSRKFAGNMYRSPAGNKIQNASRDELISKNIICMLYGCVCCSSEQIRMAWPRTCKYDRTSPLQARIDSRRSERC